MKIIRPDVEERLGEILTLIALMRVENVEEMRKQHLDRIERIVDTCLSSIEEHSEVEV